MNDQGRYWLYDTYDDEEEKYIGRFDTMEQVQEFCRDREAETDGAFWPLLKEMRMVSAAHYGTVFKESRLCVIYNWTY